MAFILFIIAVALAFDFINGFHDAANSIATVVGTRVLTPKLAVAWAAFFNFVAAFVFPLAVAKTMGKGVIQASVVDNHVILAALIGAIGWDLITWWLGLPTSSSHALIGGLAGAALVKAGWGGLIYGGFQKIVIFIVLSPAIGMVLGFAIRTLINLLLWHSAPKTTAYYFRRLQLLSAAAYSLGHGGNDAQKTMGIVALVVYGAAHFPDRIPWWIILSAHAAIAAGTMSGGWRIVKTMGMKITKLQPVDGFAAETAAAAALFGTAAAGIPVSTTHTITGSIVEVGSTRRLSAVRWGVTFSVVWAWILTIPGSALVAALMQLLLQAPGLPLH